MNSGALGALIGCSLLCSAYGSIIFLDREGKSRKNIVIGLAVLLIMMIISTLGILLSLDGVQ